MSAGRAFLIIAAIPLVSCGAPLMKLPSGPDGTPVDARQPLAEATAACKAVSTLTAEIGATGSVGGQRFRARLSAGLSAPASARLEAAAPFGAPMFILVAIGNDGTLVLPHDGRVLEHARPDAVLEALAGVPLDAADLRLALTGCATAGDGAAAKARGDDWRVVTDGANEAYLHRDAPQGSWHLVATVFHASRGGGWRAEYREFQGGLPRSVRLVGAARDSFDLRLTLSQVDVNTPLGPDVFRVQVPRDADPITLDELKRARPGVRKN